MTTAPIKSKTACKFYKFAVFVPFYLLPQWFAVLFSHLNLRLDITFTGRSQLCMFRIFVDKIEKSPWVQPLWGEDWDVEAQECKVNKPEIDVHRQQYGVSAAETARLRAERRRRHRRSRHDAKVLGGGDLKRGRAREDEFLKSLKLANAEELKEEKSSSQAADSLA